LQRAGFELGLASIGSPLKDVSPTVIAGFWGGYVWGLYDCLKRFRVRTWTPHSQYFIWFRMLLGTALGAVAGLPLKVEYGPIVAFAIGSLPFDTIIKWLQSQASDRLKIQGQPDVAETPPWSAIEGVTQDTIDRLREADVPSLCHLAYTEPVSLNSRTSIEWQALLDMMDQALLAVYVEEKLPAFRKLGIRGSIDLVTHYTRLNFAESSPRRVESEAVVRAIGTILGQEPAAVRGFIRNMYEDAQVNLIWALYYDREASSIRAASGT
jgi:hypothetical protein